MVSLSLFASKAVKNEMNSNDVEIEEEVPVGFRRKIVENRSNSGSKRKNLIEVVKSTSFDSL